MSDRTYACMALIMTTIIALIVIRPFWDLSFIEKIHPDSFAIRE